MCGILKWILEYIKDISEKIKVKACNLVNSIKRMLLFLVFISNMLTSGKGSPKVYMNLNIYVNFPLIKVIPK